MVIGEALDHSSGRFMRNRWPSAVTSYKFHVSGIGPRLEQRLRRIVLELVALRVHLHRHHAPAIGHVEEFRAVAVPARQPAAASVEMS